MNLGPRGTRRPGLNRAPGSFPPMAYASLGEFLAALESQGDLKRIRAPVSRDLEITEITQRVLRADGPALLFENVTGSSMPVVMNLLGSPRRIALALGVPTVDAAAERVSKLTHLRPPAGLMGALMDPTGTLETLSTLRSLAPRRVRSGPVQETEWDRVDLDRLPILRCWPGDGGRTITFPVVITKDPESGEPHTGIYRLQQYGPDTLGFHVQIHRVGASNLRKAAALGKKLEVAVVLGADPAVMFSGLAPVPEGISNFVFAGFLRSEPVELVPARTVDLEVPAQAEIVLEGYVDPSERKVEGPFGDHTGYYSAPEPFPVLHVTHVTKRAHPVYLSTVTGKPPTEDAVLGKAVERVFLPVIRLLLPEIVDMNLPMEGLFINVGIISIRKSYPEQPRKVMHALWGLGQMMFARYLVIVDADVDPHDLSEVLYRVGLQADPAEDTERSYGPVDQLSISNPIPNQGAKIGFDATRKRPEDGFPRPWPEEIRMDPAVTARVDELAKSDPTLRALLERRTP
jgi:4-hydroxy-3-polyprenylbenzoate decarboxylase